jgi:hypothetical protein
LDYKTRSCIPVNTVCPLSLNEVGIIAKIRIKMVPEPSIAELTLKI